MKAKCPHCEKGCERCQGGSIEISMAKGKIYTRHCDDCAFDNGGRIVPIGDMPPAEKLYPCPNCRGVNIRWVDTGAHSDDLGY